MDTFAHFHFLRPLWLTLLLPAIGFAILLWRQQSSGANWRRAIAPELIDFLIEPATERRRRWPWLLCLGWLIAITALAGPTWEKLPQPVLQKRDGLAIVLDLSLSMYAQDIQPSRLERARYKILDILQRHREGLTGLVVYSGDAHIVAPLTDDTATIANLVPALSPSMMPTYGSDPVAGIDLALKLLRNAGFERGRVLLISDGITTANIAALASRFDDHRWQLSIIGVGTEQGAPIPLPSTGNLSGGFVTQKDGSIAIAQLHRARFTELARKTGARYSDIRLDDGDLDAVLPNTPLEAGELRTVKRAFDQWRERGPQLVWLLLPLAALVFRRGWLLALVVLLPLSSPSHALEWRDLWQRPDQRAQQAFDRGDSDSAAQTFRDPAWRAAAQYRSGHYTQAAQTLAGLHGADADYNRGNALARAGKLQDAIAAYDAALRQNPRLRDAKDNRALLKKLLEQQQKSRQQQQNKSASGGKSGQQSQQSNQPRSAQSQSGNQSQPQNQQGQNEQSTPNGKNEPSGQHGESGDNNAQPSQNTQAQHNNHNAGADEKPDQQQAGQNGASTDNKAQNAQRREAEQPSAGKAGDKAGAERSQATAQANPESEAEQRQQRATEQWLRQIPDDPSGLLRRKFLYESRHRQQDGSENSDDQPAW